MIEVRVSRDDLAGLDFNVADEADNSLGLITRVDDYRGRIRLENVTVGLQPTDHYGVYLRQFDTPCRVVANESTDVVMFVSALAIPDFDQEIPEQDLSCPTKLDQLATEILNRGI